MGLNMTLSTNKSVNQYLYGYWLPHWTWPNFLVAYTRLYKSLFQSVCRSDGRSICNCLLFSPIGDSTSVNAPSQRTRLMLTCIWPCFLLYTINRPIKRNGKRSGGKNARCRRGQRENPNLIWRRKAEVNFTMNPSRPSSRTKISSVSNTRHKCHSSETHGCIASCASAGNICFITNFISCGKTATLFSIYANSFSM